MLSIKDIRSNTNYIIDSLKKRNFNEPEIIINDIIKLDKDYRENLEKKEKLLNQRNLISKELSKIKGNKNQFKEQSIKVTLLKEEISKLDLVINEKLNLINDYLMSLPNTPHEDVPVGTDENSNKVIKKFGECKTSDKILSHDKIGEKIGQLDFETAVKISGSRFVILKKISQCWRELW